MRRLALFMSAATLLLYAEDLAPPGHKPEPPGAHAITGARVFVRPGMVIENATVVIRDGRIEAVGAGLAAPADARVWDGKGLTVYAGFIDAYVTIKEPPKPPPNWWERGLTSGKGYFGVPEGNADPGQPGAGPATSRVSPERRMAKEYAPDAKALEKWRAAGLTAAHVVPETGIVRGTTAVCLLGDGNPNDLVLKADVFQHATLAPGVGEGYPDSLMGAIATIRQAFYDARWYRQNQKYAKQAGLRAEFNPALEALAPFADHEGTVLFEAPHALGVDEAAAIAREFKLEWVCVASGEEWRRPDLAKAAGVPMIVSLRFPALPKLDEAADWAQVSLDQLRGWDWAPEVPALLRREGVRIALTSRGLDAGEFRKNLRLAVDRGLSEEEALAALTTAPAEICGVGELAGTVEKGKLANLTVVEGSYFDPDARVKGVWISGRWFENEPGRAAETEEARAKKAKEKADGEKKRAELHEIVKARVAHAPLEERAVPEGPKTLVLKGGTVWTCGALGRLVADVQIENGKVTAVAKDIVPPPGAVVIDVSGKHVTPGIIDCHSHSMIVQDVNEGTLPSSAMVRIGDVVNSETDRIHEQLAGGVTAVSLLHGSANPIGGQNCVIKLREGASPSGLKFAEAPEGIKFALGENVKQSNWGEKHVTRFPQTRMGVMTFYENRFTAALRYEKAQITNGGAPMRRDLELDALVEILRGTRLIHCHSYRADEILALMRVMESFKVRIGTLQHVLEGYKVADEMAKHGVGGSCFTDWWAYKFEVYDAIPYAASLMRERGVCVSINSDSGDHARRLYLEAAKAVKYGGSTEEDALKMVTLNPAIQLGVDKHVGSLEPGKHADFAIWTASPLDSSTMCVETWIEGRRYFERAQGAARAAARVKEREAIVAKAKKVGELGGAGISGKGEGSKFFGTSLEKAADGTKDVHCGGTCDHGEVKR